MKGTKLFGNILGGVAIVLWVIWWILHWTNVISWGDPLQVNMGFITLMILANFLKGNEYRKEEKDSIRQ
jgi:hypothetical protein